MSFHVRMLRRADRDVRQIAGWISERSASGAASWMAALDSAIDDLTFDPESYGLADEDPDISEMILRQFLFKTRRGRVYRGVFTIGGEEVRILRIRGPGQDLLTAEEL